MTSRLSTAKYVAQRVIRSAAQISRMYCVRNVRVACQSVALAASFAKIHEHQTATTKEPDANQMGQATSFDVLMKLPNTNFLNTNLPNTNLPNGITEDDLTACLNAVEDVEVWATDSSIATRFTCKWATYELQIAKYTGVVSKK